MFNCINDCFYYLHKLSITCSLCIEYHRSCTQIEFIDRFVYLRFDLLNNLKILNTKINYLLIQINSNFEKNKRKKSSNQYNIKNYSQEELKIFSLYRTIFLWFIILFVIGYYFQWSIFYESSSKQGWLM